MLIQVHSNVKHDIGWPSNWQILHPDSKSFNFHLKRRKTEDRNTIVEMNVFDIELILQKHHQAAGRPFFENYR